MDLPIEIFYILIPVIFLALAMAMISNFTESGRNFRSSRNRKAKKQD